MDYEKLKESDPEGYAFVRKCEKLEEKIVAAVENEDTLVCFSVLTRILAIMILGYEDIDKAYNQVTLMIHKKIEDERFRAPFSGP